MAEEIERCHILIPSFDRTFSHLDNHGCLKKHAHNDSHLNRLSDGRFISWEDDPCNFCKPEDCECFSWGEVKLKKALEILKEKYGENIPLDVLKIVREG